MQIGLESYTFAFSTGMGYEHLQPPGFRPMDVYGLMEKAAESGLAGVSFPPERMLDLKDHKALDEVRRAAEKRGLFLNAATGGTDVERLTAVLEAASRLGCTVLRTVIGGAKIGGDRRNMAGKWQAFMKKTLNDLRALVPVCERTGVSLALENHQDLTSDELIGLIREVSSPWIGLILDVANPLGTAEDPDTFYKKVMPHIKGAHLKDYHIIPTDSGYLLARCALGEGVIDFPRLFRDFKRWAPNIRPTVELAALEARHVRVLEDDFWPEYPPRTGSELARTWRFIHHHATKDEKLVWRTPVELGQDGYTLAAYEEDQFQKSVRYLKGLLGENLIAV